MERLKVAIRLRPFLPNENESNTGINMNPDDDKTIVISKSLKTFKGTFDKILSTNSTQKDVFNFIRPCLDNIQKGINCTILAYGQTGSGKTYTMFGGDWSFNDKMNDYEKRKNLQKDEYNFLLNKELVIDPFSETNGIIPNLIMELFNIYNNRKQDNENNNIDNNDNNLTITCSYIQVYNEKIYDLLEEKNEDMEKKKKFEVYMNKNRTEKMIDQTPLKIKYDKNKGIILEGVNEIRTPLFFDIFDLLSEGETNRKIRQTNKNDMSSRSHTIFIINIEDNYSQYKCKIKLCDLAGSERYDSSGIYKKAHINEMCNINKSLFVLGNIIHILASKKKAKNYFVPYKDSKLTQILEDSLSGNSSIYLIATISPNDENFEETINTLKFADRAHEVMTSVTPNQIIDDDIFKEGNRKEIKKLYKELFELKQLLLIRAKRGNLNPLQEQLLKLKQENNHLRKCLSGGNSQTALEKLIKENNSLKKEIKELTSQNLILRNEKNIYPKKEENNIELPLINSETSELKKKLFKNSLSENDIFKEQKFSLPLIEKNNKSILSNNNTNSSIFINNGNNIVINKNNNNDSNYINNEIANDIILNNLHDIESIKEKEMNLFHKINLSRDTNDNGTDIKNGSTIPTNGSKAGLKLNGLKPIKKNYKIKSDYQINYNTINLENLGIKKEFNKNKKIMESLKRLKILDDLSKKSNGNLDNYS